MLGIVTLYLGKNTALQSKKKIIHTTPALPSLAKDGIVGDMQILKCHVMTETAELWSREQFLQGYANTYSHQMLLKLHIYDLDSGAMSLHMTS